MTNSFSVETYSASDVKLSIGGYIITGWDNLTINRRVKAFTPVYGIRGKNTRVKNVDTSATIIITLIQTSQSNDVLSYIHELDIDEGTARITLTLKDNSGRSVFSSNEAYISSYPTKSFSGDFTYNTWEIILQSTQSYTVGGNGRPSTGLLDNIISDATDFVSDLF